MLSLQWSAFLLTFTETGQLQLSLACRRVSEVVLDSTVDQGFVFPSILHLRHGTRRHAA